VPDYAELHALGRLPAAGDNVAIAVRQLEAGTGVEHSGEKFRLSHSVLEGHRFAVLPIRAGEPLLSWDLPFGIAMRDIQPGEYVVNRKMIPVLRQRNVGFAVPEEPNFEDRKLEPYILDEDGFIPGEQVTMHAEPRYFEGYARTGDRGVGTRNYVVVLGLTSRTASYARKLAEHLHSAVDAYPNVDGIVPVAHTEGGENASPNNLSLLLRTLAGFVVHPNVGAVLIAEDANGGVTGERLRRYIEEHAYPLDAARHAFLSLDGGFASALTRGAEIVRGWLPEVNAVARTPQPLSMLRIALQCGGSDAFSGVSGNPLAAWVAKQVIRYGGSANLAETDELIGAEQYVLANVRDLETARRFLATVEGFKELVRRHGHTAEDNPSGGNNYRGLYNITLKSIGAAMKRDPEVRLDHVIQYGERMSEPGFYFMDSPGNDLESIAGQVASGCTMIFFVTGNGSITNFPFVPTIKIVTTSRRFALLSKDMDVNAGAYLDGTPLEELGGETLDRTIRAASGERTAGERAGHTQVSIWRNWRQSDESAAAELQSAGQPSGEPLRLRATAPRVEREYTAVNTAHGPVTDQIGLILPTSLCSAQISRIIARRLNERRIGDGRVSRFAALPHTEGCGVSAGSAEEIYTRTLLGYLTHPLVGHGLLLEHGCEKTHNDYLREKLMERGVDASQFGWASVQLDGGIDRVVDKVEQWFVERLADAPPPTHTPAGLGSLRLGVTTVGETPPEVVRNLADLTGAVASAGGTVVVPENGDLLRHTEFLSVLLDDDHADNTLAYGQFATQNGLHIMETPTNHWVETLTGLGATGVEVVLVYTAGGPVQGHRMVPVAQVSGPSGAGMPHPDLDLELDGEPDAWMDQMLGLVLRIASREYVPTAVVQGNTDFQFTRGLLGVSM
jgi:altronate dehydratase